MRSRILASGVSFVLVACGGGGGPADDSSGDDGPDAALTGDRYAVTWGPITVQPQEERRC